MSKLFFLISICSWSQVNVLIDNNVKSKQMYSNVNTTTRPFKLIVNGKEIQNIEIFSVDKSNLAIKQKISSDTVFFTCENFKNCYFLLRHNKKKSLNGAFPGDLVSNGEYIHIYYDNRLFCNLIREKFMKGSLFFFSRYFIVDIGHDNIYIERKNKYKKITPP